LFEEEKGLSEVVAAHGFDPIPDLASLVDLRDFWPDGGENVVVGKEQILQEDPSTRGHRDECGDN
jgi:hypothetical protein